MSIGDEDAEKGYREMLKGDGKSLKSDRDAKKGDEEANFCYPQNLRIQNYVNIHRI